MYGEFEGPTEAVARLGGVQDLSQESWRAKQDLLDRLMELISGYGYRRLETPILEPTDLFMRKSGGELASRIYSFSDPGSNLVSLRPEFTSSIMRHYLESEPLRKSKVSPAPMTDSHSHTTLESVCPLQTLRNSTSGL